MAVVSSAEAKHQHQDDNQYQHSSNFLSSEFPAGTGWAELCFSACYEKHGAANERRCACDGRQRNVVCLFARSVNRSDVNDLLPGRVRKTSPCKTDQTKCNQDQPKRFGHGGLLLLLEYFFNLADFLLDLAGEFFVLAFGRQIGVVRDLSGFLDNLAFQFMKLAFDLIRRARFHLVSPLLFRELSTKARPFDATGIPLVAERANLPSSATRANENIPSLRRPAGTTREERSVWLTFLTSSVLRADWGPKLNVLTQGESRGFRELLSASPAVQEARSAEARTCVTGSRRRE
jgi:hypothetical protein